MNSKQIQLELFDQPTLNIIRPVKTAMNEDVRDSGLSRDQVVDRMNDIAGRYGVCLTRGNCKRLTIETLEKWLNPEDQTRQIPLKALPIFAAATGGTAAVNVIARSIGLRLIDSNEQKLLKWAEIEIRRRQLSRQSRKLASEVGL